MGQIKFYSSGYWDKETMKDSHEQPTEANLNKVIDFCQSLNAKYDYDNGCQKHPNTEQVIQVYFSNGVKYFTVSKGDTCGCHEMAIRLSEIAEREALIANQ
jgi:hypothetical protein